MVKRVKRLMIAASLLMLLSACGKAEADLPGTETEVQVKKKRPDRKKKAPQRQVKIQKHQQIQRLRRFRTMP